MSRDGVPGCRCNRPLITLDGRCAVCGLERLHILPKVPFVTGWLPPDDEQDAAA